MACESIVIMIAFEDVESYDMKMSLKCNTAAVRNGTMSIECGERYDQEILSKYDSILDGL